MSRFAIRFAIVIIYLPHNSRQEEALPLAPTLTN